MPGDNDKLRLQYSVDLPKPVYEILENEFWMFENFTSFMLPGMASPMKFSAPTSIYVRKGWFKAEINLQKYEMKAPCVINIHSGEILNYMKVSDDFSASFMVFSEDFGAKIMTLIGRSSIIPNTLHQRKFSIKEDLVEDFNSFYNKMNKLQHTADLPDRNTAYFYQTIAFYYATASRCFPRSRDDEHGGGESRWLSDRFLILVQKHFKKERFLKFYADELNVSTKYLSKIVKEQTGVSAAEWISRQVILEAKVLLKSSSLNVQQISVLLNFQSQSLFGKYFKTATGMSPKDFRNS